VAKNVVIGLLGSTLDGGLADKRWARWRPTVAVCQQPDFHVDRFERITTRNLFVPFLEIDPTERDPVSCTVDDQVVQDTHAFGTAADLQTAGSFLRRKLRENFGIIRGRGFVFVEDRRLRRRCWI